MPRHDTLIVHIRGFFRREKRTNSERDESKEESRAVR